MTVSTRRKIAITNPPTVNSCHKWTSAQSPLLVTKVEKMTRIKDTSESMGSIKAYSQSILSMTKSEFFMQVSGYCKPGN